MDALVGKPDGIELQTLVKLGNTLFQYYMAYGEINENIQKSLLMRWHDMNDNRGFPFVDGGLLEAFRAAYPELEDLKARVNRRDRQIAALKAHQLKLISRAASDQSSEYIQSIAILKIIGNMKR